MAQAIVTSQLMSLHFGRLKDLGRLSPVQARPPCTAAASRSHSFTAITCSGACSFMLMLHLALHAPKAANPARRHKQDLFHSCFESAAALLSMHATSLLEHACAAGISLPLMLGFR